MNNISETTIENRRTEFRKLLHQLARTNQNVETVDRYYAKFEKIYQDGFRHYYCDITRTMYDIAKCQIDLSESPNNKSEEEDIYALSSRVLYLYDHYQTYRNSLKDSKKKHIDINDNLRKLYDHVHLESIRINYSDIGDKRLAEHGMTLRDLSNQVNNLDKKALSMSTRFEEINDKSNSIETRSKEIEDKLSKAQTDYIAILGIFASVVLAFVGGMAFSTSVLENIKDVSIYRLLIVALIIGIVFVTVIFLMFYFIGVLTGRHLNDERSIHPLLLSYGLFILLIAIVYAMWYHGDVETRNKRVDDQATIVETSVEPDVTSQIYFEQNNATTE